MRRTIVLITVLLLGGAIVNVAVAWGFAARRPSMVIERYQQGGFVLWGRPWQVVQQRRLGMIDVWWYDLHQEYPQTIAAEALIDSHNESRRQRQTSGPPMPSGRRVEALSQPPRWGTFRHKPLPNHIYMGGDIAFGFPRACLWMRTTSEMIGMSTANEQLHGGWLIKGAIQSRGNKFIALPNQIIWPGFAVNTIFYSAILGLLFLAPGKVRRTIRRRRGLCAKCAYPVGTSAVCTECGAVVQPRRGDGM